MSKSVIIKPIISEKSELLSDSLSKYSFVVANDANKIEIRTAIEAMYSVNVAKVNTIVTPTVAKVRNTRRGIQKGRVSSYKKAIITLQDGEAIDFFGEV